jgi:AcrR family transcriptional regulator
VIVKDAQLEWVRRPLQARSQQTLDRLLDAAEAIIEEKGLDGLTVGEVTRRAGSSVGAFYSRFADKEGLVRVVFERFTDQALATTEVVLDPARWQGVPVLDVLETMMMFMLNIVRERQGLVAALVARSALDPSLTALGERLHEHICMRMRALVIERGDSFAHEDPDAGMQIAVGMVLSFMESRAVYRTQRLPDERVASEVARLIVDYLGVTAAQDLPASSKKTNGRPQAPPSHAKE